ncbi:MAG: MaoC family dehydratase [Eubacterium aggregans]|uniref:3-hydroxybutyryl-CoA dehydratase n=1 Tax=Eubacterium aggregans TaxID=81409 RepID=A0A1H3XTW7_9FIRM|nr:MaoC family dehydratase [Eubacterium aggregans]MDD4690763.1 MaoC family dehydratase [Eubacterium aggregans]MEA5072741.1 MaoC family dehydratase [Eubacterium aggregans]SEA02680.1 3-hydroxybutyryl-CoA dehydratase [Eubacterium aggregans]
MITPLKIGDSYTISKKITEEDVVKFAEVTGDNNPLHLDADYASKSMFGGRIAHGMISAGIISGALGTGMPGIGTTYLGQELSFCKPVKIGDTLTVSLTVDEILHKKKFDIAKIKTLCTNEVGETVVNGIATVIPPQ